MSIIKEIFVYSAQFPIVTSAHQIMYAILVLLDTNYYLLHILALSAIYQDVPYAPIPHIAKIVRLDIFAIKV